MITEVKVFWTEDASLKMPPAPLLLEIIPEVIPVNRYDVSFYGAQSWWEG